jgi:hypothetical protein
MANFINYNFIKNERLHKFPKKLKKLSKKKIISDSFMKLWHQELKKISIIENFNHNYVAKSEILSKKKLKL